MRAAREWIRGEIKGQRGKKKREKLFKILCIAYEPKRDITRRSRIELRDGD